MLKRWLWDAGRIQDLPRQQARKTLQGYNMANTQLNMLVMLFFNVSFGNMKHLKVHIYIAPIRYIIKIFNYAIKHWKFPESKLFYLPPCNLNEHTITGSSSPYRQLSKSKGVSGKVMFFLQGKDHLLREEAEVHFKLS